MAAKEAKKVVELDVVKDKRERMALKRELEEVAILKNQVKEITNSAKSGTLDLLNQSVIERMTKLGLTDQWVQDNGYKHALQPGMNVSFRESNIKKAMMDYGIDPDVQEAIIMEAKTVTRYMSVVTKAVGEE